MFSSTLEMDFTYRYQVELSVNMCGKTSVCQYRRDRAARAGPVQSRMLCRALGQIEAEHQHGS